MNTIVNNYRKPLILLTSLFFIWGFITCLNDILIPHLKDLFELNYTETMLIQFCFFGAYFIMSIPSGWIIGKIGYKKGIVLGLIVTGIGSFLFYPASILIYYPLFLFALFILASGITILQVAANPYVAILGKPETASSRLNLTQAFNSLGTTVAPIFGTYLILSNVSSSTVEKAESVQLPYIGLAITLVLIAVVFALIKLPQIKDKDIQSTISNDLQSKRKSAWAYPHLVLGTVAIFLYVGGEVSIGSFLVNFLGESNIANIPVSEAGNFVSFYWGGAMLGRFIGSAVMQKIKPNKVLTFNAVTVIILILITITFTGKISMWAILSVGLFNSIMFPTIFTLSIKGLGKHTSQASGILCMAIVGGAIVPLLQGFVADNIGLQYSFIVAALCYVYIFYFGLKGYKKQLVY
ncbi:MAG: sugar MFS transporter [Bacteroidota bacterium]|nr:sugar MFS transporter [Bacteroidota bacterium]